MNFLVGQKKRPKIPIFSTINNEILQNFEGKNHGLVHGKWYFGEE